VAWLPDSLVRDAAVGGGLLVAGGDRWTVPLEVRLTASPATVAAGAAQLLWMAAQAAARQGGDTADQRR